MIVTIPEVIINGRRLTDKQAATLRVAISGVQLDIAEMAERSPEVEGYRQVLAEIILMMEAKP